MSTVAVQHTHSFIMPYALNEPDAMDEPDLSWEERRHLEAQENLARHRRVDRMLRGILDCPRARAQHKKRVPIYKAKTLKLAVEPDAALETPWGDMPTELMELVAAHLHPRDIGRLRGVSSGWRAAFWQERVVRASLRGCGPRVDETLMTGMFMHSRAAWKAIGDQVDVSTKAKWKARCATEYHETLWKPVLDSMEPWGEFLHARTHDTVSRICIALVPFAHTGDERVPELYAMDHLAHRAGGRRGPSAGVSCV